MKGKDLYLNIKPVQGMKDLIFIGFYSMKSCNVLFQYCYEKEPPDPRIIPPNKGLNENAI